MLVLLVLALALLRPLAAQAAPGFAPSCAQALPKQQIDELTATLREADTRSPCELSRVDTQMFRTLIEWRSEDGQTLAMRLAPRGCVLEPSHEGPELAYWAAPELESRCPAAVAELREFVGEPREELVPVIRDQAVGSGPSLEPGVEPKSPLFTPLRVASLAWLLALLLAGLSARSGERPSVRRPSRELTLILLLSFGLALLARALVPASIANWYGPFLPPEGLGEQRFGASSTSLQALARALSPWGVEHAFALMRVTGALAVPLLVLVVRRLGGSLSACALAGVLLALAPIAVRTSASSSEHVLAGTLALGAWAAWLRTPSDPRLAPRLLCLTLVLLAVLARVDCWPQLALIPLWAVLGRRALEADSDELLPLRRRLLDLGLYTLGWAAIGVYAYYRVVIPSNHPGPDPANIRATAEVLFSQLWTASVEPPHWISPLTLALAIGGLGLALWQRRLGLLLAALPSWALIFVPLGRNLTHDGLTGARYFILALPILILLASCVGDALEELADRHLVDARARLRRPLTAGLTALLLLLGVLAARPGWRHTYTFQAEYLWLAEQLEAQAEQGSLDACTLWFVRPRQPTGEVDLDCCLAPDRSPLRLVAPELEFQPMSSTREPDDEQGCHLYYAGSLCSLEPELSPRVSKGVARIQAQCAQLRECIGTELVVTDEVTRDSLRERFRQRPRLELHTKGR